MTQDTPISESKSAGSPQRMRCPRLSSIAVVIVITLLALALRLAAVKLVGPDPGITTYSESGMIAANLLDGRGYTYDFYSLRRNQPLRSFVPPLYVGLVYACLRWATHPALALALAQAVLSSLVCAAIYLIALTLSGKRSVAILAALAAACYPVLILMVNVPHSPILHTALLLWAVAATLLLPSRRGWGWSLLAGILWGLIALGRPTLLGFMPFVLFYLWLNRTERRDWLKTGAVLATAMILVVLPWTIRNYLIHGQIVPIATNGGFNFWVGNNPFTTGSGHDVYTEKVDQFMGRSHDPKQAAIVQIYPYPLPADIQTSVATVSELALDRQLYQAGLAFIRQHPEEWIRLVRQKLVSFWWFRPRLGASYEASWTPYYKLMYALLMVVFGAGLAMSLRHGRRYSLLYLLFAYYTVVNVAFQVLTRFRWEIEPLFLVFAALCVVGAAERLSAGRRAARNARLGAAS